MAGTILWAGLGAAVFRGDGGQVRLGAVRQPLQSGHHRPIHQDRFGRHPSKSPAIGAQFMTTKSLLFSG
jgi:hypothetical protein